MTRFDLYNNQTIKQRVNFDCYDEHVDTDESSTIRYYNISEAAQKTILSDNSINPLNISLKFQDLVNKYKIALKWKNRNILRSDPANIDLNDITLGPDLWTFLNPM